MLSLDKSLYISVLACLFVILNVFVGMKTVLKNYNTVMLFVVIVVVISLATLSTLNEK